MGVYVNVSRMSETDLALFGYEVVAADLAHTKYYHHDTDTFHVVENGEPLLFVEDIGEAMQMDADVAVSIQHKAT